MPSIHNVKLLAGVHLRMEGKRVGIYQLTIFVGFKGARFYKQHAAQRHSNSFGAEGF